MRLLLRRAAAPVPRTGPGDLAGPKIYHDIGWPSEWARAATSTMRIRASGTSTPIQTGVADYVGVYDYPFQTRGYIKAQATRSARQGDRLRDQLDARCPGLARPGTTLVPATVIVFPTQAQLLDWNCPVRKRSPPAALIPGTSGRARALHRHARQPSRGLGTTTAAPACSERHSTTGAASRRNEPTPISSCICGDRRPSLRRSGPSTSS